MPAVTVENILTLPRVSQPTAEAVSRPVRVGHHRTAGRRG